MSCNERNKKISIAFEGIPLSDEHKNKISKKLMGRVSKLKGQPKSLKTRKLISESEKGKIVSDKTKQLMSEKHMGVCLSLDHCKKIGDAQRGHKHNDIWCQNIKNGLIKRYKDPAMRQKTSEIVKKRKTNMWYHETINHIRTKQKIASLLESLSYNVYLERFITIDSHRYAIDIYAEKEGNIILVEVGSCKKQKLLEIMARYPIILQVPKMVIYD